MFLKQMSELKKIASIAQKQGKSEQEMKRLISLYLIESKKKINSNGELDLI